MLRGCSSTAEPWTAHSGDAGSSPVSSTTPMALVWRRLRPDTLSGRVSLLGTFEQRSSPEIACRNGIGCDRNESVAF